MGVFQQKIANDKTAPKVNCGIGEYCLKLKLIRSLVGHGDSHR
jgi:hypothetical protein